MTTLHQRLNPFHKARPAVEPFDYNPSSWSQRVVIALLALVGFGIACYLGLYQWGLVDHLWDPFFQGTDGKNGSETVVTSDVSQRMERLIHLPDGVLGAIAYLGDALFGFAGSTRRWQYRPWLVVLFGFDVIPLGVVGVILTVTQGTVIGSWCTLCLASAAISAILVWMAYDEVWVSLIYLYRVWTRSGRSYGLLWRTFWGRPSQLAHDVAEEMIRNAATKAAQKSPAG